MKYNIPVCCKRFCYLLGKFVASTMLKGIIHPDMQLPNIGDRDKDNFAFLDYADVKFCAIPDGLSDDTLRQLTQALFSATNNFLDYPESLAYFRAGFVAYGGLLGQCLFCNMTNYGFSILDYLDIGHAIFSFDSSFLYKYTQNKDAIKEWKNIPFEKITISNYDCLEKYEQSAERKYISKSNRYYIDNLYLSRCYIELELKQSNHNIPVLNHNIPSLIMSMGSTALRSKFYYIAYGLLRKCLSLPDKTAEIISMCNLMLINILISIPLNTDITNLISNSLDLDLFCFLWLLCDLEHCNLVEKE